MRAAIVVCGVVALAWPIGANSRPGPSQGLTAQTTGAISGVVVDALTGQPIAGAIVSLGRIEGGRGASPGLPLLLTDTRGRFVFRNLPASPGYFLGARRTGYSYTRYGWTAPNGALAISDILMIPIADGQWTSTIKIPLWRLGVITGRVVDERSEPVVGVAVRVFSSHTIAGQPQLAAGPIATTDDRGMYRIADLDPGRYVVSVLSVQSTVLATTPEEPQRRAVGELESGGIGASSGTSLRGPAVDVDGRHRLAITNFATPPPPAGAGSRAYPAMFFPASTSVAGAASIDIGYGDSRSGVDFQLRPVPTVRVSGHLEGSAGPPPRFLLRLLPTGSERLGFGSETATTQVEPEGTFTFLNVPEGQYTLLAQAGVMDFTSGDAFSRLADAPGFPGGGISVGSMRGVPDLGYLARKGKPEPTWGRSAIAVGTTDVTDAVVQLHPAVEVRGHVVFAAGTKPPAPDHGLLVIAHPANGDPSFGAPTTVTTPGDPAFPFTMPGLLAGTYVLVGTSGSYSIVSVTWEGRDVTDSGFDASLSRDFDGVVVTLTDQKTEITGQVHDKSGPAVAGVIAFPVERVRWSNYGWSPPRFRTARSGPSGAFQIQGLPEGDYYVIAVDATKINAWTDPAFLNAAAPAATRVSVKWGGSMTADLQLIHVTVK